MPTIPPSLPRLPWGHLDEPSQDSPAASVEPDHGNRREPPAWGAEKGWHEAGLGSAPPECPGERGPPTWVPHRKGLDHGGPGEDNASGLTCLHSKLIQPPSD